MEFLEPIAQLWHEGESPKDAFFALIRIVDCVLCASRMWFNITEEALYALAYGPLSNQVVDHLFPVRMPRKAEGQDTGLSSGFGPRLTTWFSGGVRLLCRCGEAAGDSPRGKKEKDSTGQSPEQYAEILWRLSWQEKRRPGIRDSGRSRLSEDERNSLFRQMTEWLVDAAKFFTHLQELELRRNGRVMVQVRRILKGDRLHLHIRTGNNQQQIEFLYIRADFQKEVADIKKSLTKEVPLDPIAEVQIVIRGHLNRKGRVYEVFCEREVIPFGVEVSAPFFIDRGGRILWDSSDYRSRWNGAAIECAARALRENLTKIINYLGDKAVAWLARVYGARGHEKFGIFWQELEPVLAETKFVSTATGSTAVPGEIFLLPKKLKLSTEQIYLLEAVGIRLLGRKTKLTPQRTNFLRSLGAKSLAAQEILQMMTQAVSRERDSFALAALRLILLKLEEVEGRRALPPAGTVPQEVLPAPSERNQEQEQRGGPSEGEQPEAEGKSLANSREREALPRRRPTGQRGGREEVSGSSPGASNEALAETEAHEQRTPSAPRKRGRKKRRKQERIPSAVRKGTPGTGDPAETQRIRNLEREAMDAVMALESGEGREPVDVSREKLGYDIVSGRWEGGEFRVERFIEVKGTQEWTEVGLTENEWEAASRHKGKFYLYVVELPKKEGGKQQKEPGQIYIIQDPVSRVSGFALDPGWKKLGQKVELAEDWKEE